MRMLLLMLCLFAAPLAQAQTPANPNFPANPAVPQAPIPASPTLPEATIPEAWPTSSVPTFMLACTQGQREILAHCRCVIEALMQQIPHREFMILANENRIETDRRYLSIRKACLRPAKR